MPGEKTSRVSGLVMDLREGDVISVGPCVQLTVLKKSGRLMRVRIRAPIDMRVAKEPGHIELQQRGAATATSTW